MSVRPRDSSEWIALCACFVPLIGVLPHTDGPTSTANGFGILISWLPFLFALPFVFLLTCGGQITMYFVVRRIQSKRAKLAGAILSFAMALWYTISVIDADLSGSSTAAVGLVLYPYVVQWWAWLLSFAAVFAVAKIED